MRLSLPLRIAGALARRTPGLLIAAALLAAPVQADDPPPFAARAGLELARGAAEAWAADAVLVYVENDEALDGAGTAGRWGYLFHSATLDQSRAYSVREGRVLVAENLAMKFEAPPVVADWIDSGPAIAAANQAARAFLEKEHGRLSNMLLMRGAFHEKDPDQTTWTLIYTAPGAPSLFVVVDAAAGKVRRTWRG